MTKTCTKCGETKPMDDFHRQSAAPSGRAAECRVCNAARSRAYRARNLERLQAYDRERLATDPKRRAANIAKSKEHRAAPGYKERRVEHNLKNVLKKLGMTREEYDAKLDEQGGKCAICRTSLDTGRRPAIDHCHETGKVRGLLCIRCNSGIGHLRDSVDLVFAAAAYLLEHDTELEVVLT